MSSERTTLVGTPLVVAPGKVFLVGEYAVLEEGIAVLAAVSRHAVGQYIPGLAPFTPLVAESVRRAKAELGDAAAALPQGSVLVNTDAFHQDDQKLGFGSSAAAAVVSVGAVFESAGLSIETRKPQILAIADAAHRASQGGMGSGADVAAAVYGGLIQVLRLPGRPPEVTPLHPPQGLHLVVFWTGASASSKDMMEGVARFAKKDSLAYLHIMDNLREIALRFSQELQAGRATGAVAAAGRYGKQLAVLGTAAGIPIVTEAFTRAAEVAKELGGIAKPSGAGGGDIGVAMFATPEAARLFARACQRPLSALDLDLDRKGVRLSRGNTDESENSGLFHV
jgi:phosphomevalonate kinase